MSHNLGADKRFHRAGQKGKGETSKRMRPVKRGVPTKGKRTHAKSHLVVQKRAKTFGRHDHKRVV